MALSSAASSAQRRYLGGSTVGNWWESHGGTPRAASVGGSSTTGGAAWSVGSPPSAPRAASVSGSLAATASMRQRSPSPPRSLATAVTGPGGDELRFVMAGVSPKDRSRTVKLFENAPQTQSLVNQVVFGRDMDVSVETQYDPESTDMFKGSAGKGTWELTPETQGKRTYTGGDPKVIAGAQFGLKGAQQLCGADLFSKDMQDTRDVFNGTAGLASRVHKPDSLKTYGSGPGHLPPFDWPAVPPPPPHGRRPAGHGARALRHVGPQASPRC